jgi:hypothetical protein
VTAHHVAGGRQLQQGRDVGHASQERRGSVRHCPRAE